jgi:uncharacterized protein
MPNDDARQLIDALGLTRHAEGGYFREVWRSDRRDASGRSLASSIEYLLEAGDYSAFHRLRSDEIWYFHAGGPLGITMILPDGTLGVTRIGPPGRDRDLSEAIGLQAVLPAGTWFAAAPESGTSYTIIGCVAVPGFEYGDWELGGRDSLVSAYPAHRETIERWTRG